MKKKFLLSLIIISCFFIVFAGKNSSKNNEITYLSSTDIKVEKLISKMTLEEKIGQMTQIERKFITDENDVKKYFFGSILSGGDSELDENSPEEWLKMVNKYQSIAMQTRLKIPLIYGIDAVHGHNNIKPAVIFPHNIGLGCTFNPDLVEKSARVTAIEMAATGIRWNFAPCIAVVNDERWGRTYEGFSENTELVTKLGLAAINGYQGSNLKNSTSVAACAKHYIGDGGTTNGIDKGNTQISEKKLRELYLPPFEEAVKNNVQTIMVSFSSFNGVPMHKHKYLITDVLKNELNFKGFVVSDWEGTNTIEGKYIEQIEQAINAGIDMFMVPHNYIRFTSTVKMLVDNGKVSEDRINDAVKRILKVKYDMGLFEKPFMDNNLINKVGSKEHREIARQCVRESLVLLKNKNNVLPLSKNLKKIIVAGKTADDLGNQCGGWTISWQGNSGNITEGTTILEAIKNTCPDTEIVFNKNGINKTDADVGIVVIGEKPYAETSGDDMDLSLDPEDILAVNNLKKSGIPVIVILISGRPMIINKILGKSDAFIAAWLPGTEGQGIADVIFGDYKPIGKLSYSWPKNMKQIPINYGDKNYNPLFKYGYGLTYE